MLCVNGSRTGRALGFGVLSLVTTCGDKIGGNKVMPYLLLWWRATAHSTSKIQTLPEEERGGSRANAMLLEYNIYTGLGYSRYVMRNGSTEHTSLMVVLLLAKL